MKKILIAALVILAACSGQKSEEPTEPGVTITGKVNYPLSGLVTLRLLEGNAVTVKDTIELDKDNTFSFFLPNSEPLIYQINFFFRKIAKMDRTW